MDDWEARVRVRMGNNRGLKIGLAVALSSFLILASAQAQIDLDPFELQTARPREWRILPQAYYFKSNSNYGASGQDQIPTGFVGYSRLGVSALIAYGLHESVTPFARLGWTTVSVETTGKKSNAYGFGDQTLGLDFRIYSWAESGGLHLLMQGDIPAYDNSNSLREATPFLGDGTLNVTAGAFLSHPLSSGKTYTWVGTGGGGFLWRTKKFSTGFPWSVGVHYSARKSGFLASLQGFGLVSAENDAATRTGIVPGGGTSGSFMTEARNASFLSIAPRVGYRIGPSFDIFTRYVTTLSGTNAPKSWQVALGAEIRLGADHADEPSDRITPEEYGKSNRGFVDYGSPSHVTSVNDRLHLVKINRGSSSGLKVGQTVDVFKPTADGSAGETIARGRITEVKSGEAVIKVQEYFKEVWIQEGFIVQKPLQ